MKLTFLLAVSSLLHPLSRAAVSISCPSHYCDIGDEKRYAWVDAQSQKYTSGKRAALSQVFGQRTIGYCRKASTMDAVLNNGRECSQNNQCISRRCLSGICSGKSLMENCAQHSDCNTGLACIQETGWPFASKCRPLGNETATCVTSYDCKPSHYCWYQSAADAQSDTKRCMQLYAKPINATFGWRYVDPTDDMTNALINGQACATGFAIYTGSFQARCTPILKIASDFGTVPAPYACSVANPSNTCRYYYSELEYLTQDCQCGFDPTIGYCPYPGQEELSKHINAQFKVLNVSNCHTLDRFNLRAQAETCGMGPQIELKAAISIAFNYTQWPFIQKESAASCLMPIHPHTEANMLLSGAQIIGGLVIAVGIIAFSLL
ncbi:hypothetical protein FGO68_gene11125 [Halteria grandinella]|uniref:Uncharacterized protein n=1 Tax=Halteria grandinella TaxID=5974 RepID=A0A8J8NEU0_HALGN|nr:hypothetical protein FGO68_gene11125 [Halteria grandinella]